MAGSVSGDYGVGRSSEGISSVQSCQSGEALAEWRSSEQVENGTPSTSPPYWDTDDDDRGPKPSELFGKFTWKVENFSQITKRELRSNIFEVGGYKWYILIYPQGCDVCNHLSLFLCVANHDKLLPGWSHFAQFTIAAVNKDPKKSKYSDTLHRFWKKEHDWGWKKFMELSKVLDGFIVADALVIKAQVQVIRENSHRPFRCLDCQYRRELVRVYLTNVEQICRRFVEERRGKLGKLIEDKLRWSSFSAFWLGVDQNARHRMSREKTDMILKVVVKHFFIEKEVTSTLVMDSLYSGLKALECQSKSKKRKAKLLDTEETPAPIVHVEKDMFVLADDILSLLERAALEPLPPKDEKGPQNRTKEGTSGEDFNKDYTERDERRLTELGRRTVEIFVLAHIFSNRIEVAYQEAVALKRQEELIREEEAAGQAESEQKAKRGAAEKEKRTKKKQSKQKRSSRKGKDKGMDEKSDVAVQDGQRNESSTDGRAMEDICLKRALSILEMSDTLEDASDVSLTVDVETFQPFMEDRGASPVNWDTDTSEVHPATEASGSGVSELPVQNEQVEKKRISVVDDSSSTCSTDSVPSVVTNGPYRGNFVPKYRSQTSPGRGKNRRSKERRDRTGRLYDMDSQKTEPGTDIRCLQSASETCSASGPGSESVLSLKDRSQWLEHHLVEKEVEVVTLQKKLVIKDEVDVERPSKQRVQAEASSSSGSPTRSLPSYVQSKPLAESTTPAESFPVKETSSNSLRQMEKAVSSRTLSIQIPAISKSDTHRTATLAKPSFTPIEVAAAHRGSVMSRPSSSPLIPGPRPTAPVVSMVQTAPQLARPVSAAGQLGTDLSPPTQSSYAPQSYRNAMMGKSMGASLAGFPHHPPSSAISPSPAYPRPPAALVSSAMLSSQISTRKDESTVRSGFTFGSVTPEILHNQPEWVECSQHSLLNGIQKIDLYGSNSSGSQLYFSDELPAGVSDGVSTRQAQGVSSDEFPHLDIINYLLDEEHNIGKAAKASAVLSPNHGRHHPLNRQFTFPVDMAMSLDVGPSINGCRFDHLESYHDGINQVFGSSNGPFNGLGDVVPIVGLPAYANGQIDEMIHNQWPMGGVDLSLLSMGNTERDNYPYQVPDYSNLACGINGYTVYLPSNGH